MKGRTEGHMSYKEGRKEGRWEGKEEDRKKGRKEGCERGKEEGEKGRLREGRPFFSELKVSSFSLKIITYQRNK